MCSAGATKSAYLGDRLVLRSLRLSLGSNSFGGKGVLLPRMLRKRQVIQASFFGVGAPEAILVGVVALVVFGPRGLAEAVKALGNTLRTFQPTIRELASVSSELRNTLEEQIGLDEIRKEIRSATLPPLQTKPVFTDMPKSGQPPSAPTGTADETEGSLQGMKEQFVKDSDPDIERKRAEAAAMAWGNSSEKPSGLSIPTASQAEQLQSAPPTKQLSMMTIEELEAELARRKGTSDKARNM
eukprot:jgi/Botrbrau1/12586/Bobra.0169s0115.1